MTRWAGIAVGAATVLAASLLSSGEPAQAATLAFPTGQGWRTPVGSGAVNYNDWGFGTCNASYSTTKAHLGTDSQGILSGAAVAITAGTVVKLTTTGWTAGGAVGVEHKASDGTRFVAVYGHVNPSVTVGQTVSTGQQIGTLAKWLTSGGDNTHLHLGIRPLGAGEAGTAVVLAGTATPCPTPDLKGYVNPIPWLAAHSPGTSLDQYVGNIVKWRNADGSTVSWLVYADKTRRWISSTSTYSCLVNHGAIDKGVQSSTVLGQLRDRTGSWATCSPPARPTGSTVTSGQGLDRAVTIRSSSGYFSATQQTDGNFVVYKYGGRASWANGANGPTAWTVLQGDGNLVSYDVIGRARWASNTGGNGASRLVMQNDGNLVVYRNSDGRATWASGTGGHIPPPQPSVRTDRLNTGQGLWRGGATLTSGDGRFWLTLQGSDGNLVIYQSGVGAIWALGARNDDFLVNQGDGNLVLYRTNAALWATGTTGAGTLVMQNDGNLVLYRKSDGRAVWASGSRGR